MAAVLADVGPEAARLDVAAWLRELRSAAEAGERLDRTRVSALEQAGARAASDGLALPVVIDAWLTAGWVLWRDIESGRRTVEALLRALDDGAKALAAGFVREQRSAVRRDESARAVLLDDLLGEAPVDDVLAAAERAGVDVGRERAVLVVDATTEAVLDRLRDAGALAAPRQGTVVAVLDGVTAPRGPERAGLGRPGAGVAGIRRSYREARSALQVAARLDLNGVVPYVEVLPEALLLQDRAGPRGTGRHGARSARRRPARRRAADRDAGRVLPRERQRRGDGETARRARADGGLSDRPHRGAHRITAR